MKKVGQTFQEQPKPRPQFKEDEIRDVPFEDIPNTPGTSSTHMEGISPVDKSIEIPTRELPQFQQSSPFGGMGNPFAAQELFMRARPITPKSPPIVPSTAESASLGFGFGNVPQFREAPLTRPDVKQETPTEEAIGSPPSNRSLMRTGPGSDLTGPFPQQSEKPFRVYYFNGSTSPGYYEADTAEEAIGIGAYVVKRESTRSPMLMLGIMVRQGNNWISWEPGQTNTPSGGKSQGQDVTEFVKKQQLPPSESSFVLKGGKISFEQEQTIAEASDKDTPPRTLAKLASHQNYLVREQVALNTSTPGMALERLARSKEWEVRLAVADNPSTPPHTLRALVGDPHPTVKNAAISRH